jgi:hypothetical protein
MIAFHSELILPTHADAATIARSYVRELSALARLPQDQGDLLADAAAQACADIVRSALGPSGRDPFHIVGLVTPRALTVAIRERGAPFASSQDVPQATRGSSSALLQGIAWERLRQAADAVHWLNRGSEGMELHLVKHRRDGDITEHLNEADLTPFRDDEPLAPEQPYTIRRFQPEDAVGVAQAMYRSFGYSYGDADVYYPARIVHLNETGQLVSVVALDEVGAVVGHLGLERPDLGPIAESSDAAVAPAHRHRHLLERLRVFAEEEGSRLGLQGLVGYPVTTHPFSQRMEETVGGRLCAVVLGQLPRSTGFKGIKSAPTNQRVSTMLYFKYLLPPSPVIVHAPPRHARMLERIYANLGVATAQSPPRAPTEAGRLTVRFERAWGYGEIYVDGIDVNTAVEVRCARRDLCALAGTEVVYLYLPLAQAGTLELCEVAEADGFFFSGLAPRFVAAGDALCLQYVPAHLDPGVLEVASPFGRELLAYVAAERERVRA